MCREIGYFGYIGARGESIDPGSAVRDLGAGTGIRDPGCGIRDAGSGIRDQGSVDSTIGDSRLVTSDERLRDAEPIHLQIQAASREAE